MKNNAKLAKITPKDDPVVNDFHREMLFHQQAQAAVIDGISRLKKLGVYTKRLASKAILFVFIIS